MIKVRTAANKGFSRSALQRGEKEHPCTGSQSRGAGSRPEPKKAEKCKAWWSLLKLNCLPKQALRYFYWLDFKLRPTLEESAHSLQTKHSESQPVTPEDGIIAVRLPNVKLILQPMHLIDP